MNDFQIESGVPMPDCGKSTGRLRVYPWLEMDVGDSFPIPEGKHDHVRTAASSWTKRHPEDPRAFTVRKMECGAYRCWRIA